MTTDKMLFADNGDYRFGEDHQFQLIICEAECVWENWVYVENFEFVDATQLCVRANVTSQDCGNQSHQHV